MPQQAPRDFAGKILHLSHGSNTSGSSAMVVYLDVGLRFNAPLSTHPWVPIIAAVCASRLIAEGPPSIVYRNGLVSYRNLLRQKYHIYPKGCVDSGNRGIYKCP